MPRDDLTLEMNARGGRETRREIDKTGRSTRNLGKDFVDARDKSNMFERALRLLGTRMGMIIILGVALSLTLGPPLLVALTLLTAALVTLGGVFAGGFIVGLAVAQRWAETVKSAGSAAWELNQAFQNIRKRFSELTASGADTVMRSLAKALEILAPLMETLAPAFNALATAIAVSIEAVAQGLTGLGPDFSLLLYAAAPLIQQLATAIEPLGRLLANVGLAGIPVLQVLVGWLIDFVRWLGPAIADLTTFAQSAEGQQVIADVFGAVVAAAKALGPFLLELGRLLVNVFKTIQPFLPALGVVLVGALMAVTAILKFVNDNFDVFLAVLVGVGVVLVSLSPMVWLVVAAVIAIGVALIYAWQHSEAFRQILIDIWNWIQNKLVPALVSAGDWIKTAFGDAVDFIVPKITWLIDKIKWIVDKAGGVSGLLGKGRSLIHTDVPFIPGIATGGTIQRGGVAVVGERGPEMVHLPTGSTVTPNGGGSEAVTVVHATLVMPDGEVLARQTLRAARRKQSVS
jgi:phage-related protein